MQAPSSQAAQVGGKLEKDSVTDSIEDWENIVSQLAQWMSSMCQPVLPIIIPYIYVYFIVCYLYNFFILSLPGKGL
jgi:hypothetical protein